MNRSLVIGTFTSGDAIVAAARSAREAGLTIVDAYTPYAVHGLDKAMALPPSRLSWACLVAGVTGAVLKLWFELWTAVVDWPLNVGGKPDNSLPAFVPITFEVMVLFAGFATVAALFMVARLWPGRRARMPVDGVTDDRFALVIEQTSAVASAAHVRAVLERHGAVAVTEAIDRGPR